MPPIVAAFRGEYQQSMYLGVWRLGARNPAPLLGVGEKCALEVSNSGLGAPPILRFSCHAFSEAIIGDDIRILVEGPGSDCLQSVKSATTSVDGAV